MDAGRNFYDFLSFFMYMEFYKTIDYSAYSYIIITYHDYDKVNIIANSFVICYISIAKEIFIGCL
jgi:hypothetical protein